METVENKTVEEVKTEETAPKMSKNALKREKKRQKWLELKAKIKQDKKVVYFFVSNKTIDLAQEEGKETTSKTKKRRGS
jgi:hypothetical protein